MTMLPLRRLLRQALSLAIFVAAPVASSFHTGVVENASLVSSLRHTAAAAAGASNKNNRKVRSVAGALSSTKSDTSNEEKVDLCIIGGGISGLTAAITAAVELKKTNPSIVLLEADTACGGRVRSDRTPDGFTLDRGFAVFIEEYPASKKHLDYSALQLQQFLPGARVKLLGNDKLASVSDPLRRPQDLLKAIVSPVGTWKDKLKLIPLFYTVVTKSVEELFEMEETNVKECLEGRYGFSRGFVEEFFCPFLEGIYLTGLENQSSRMFHFVFRMFTLGSASLPAGGMQSVADQLVDKAKANGVDVRVGTRVQQIVPSHAGSKDGFDLVTSSTNDEGAERRIRANSIVLASDVKVAQDLLSRVDGLDPIESLSEPSQRSVGCMYYSFSTRVPLEEPILILNGEGSGGGRNVQHSPINNVCFPSVVQPVGYAPPGHHLCSVVILERAMDVYDGDEERLDVDVRKQLAQWFPDCARDILDESIWKRRGFYAIRNAQPGHYNPSNRGANHGGGADFNANVNGGRDSSKFRGVDLPEGIFVSGDHMATSTLNGAFESGENAGMAAAGFLRKVVP